MAAAAAADASPHFILTARHSPFELAVLAVALITGVINLVANSTSPSLQAVAAAIPFYPQVWGAGLVLGSTAGLVSVFLKIPMSLILERIGLSLLATLFTSYGIAIGLAAGGRGIGSVLLVGSFAIGSVLRILAINRDIRLIGKAAAA
jgi:hypothetical protein